jgi:dTDP-4-dehydrorhamnose 3,5-epimerase
MAIQVTATALPEVKIIEPKVFGDARGFFYESFNAREFSEQVKTDVAFVGFVRKGCCDRVGAAI